MKIPHLREDGGFRPQMRAAIERLHSSDFVRCSVKAKAAGYANTVQITVGPPAEEGFEADITLPDWTRFPARIRAVATELRDQRLPGRYRVGHEKGDIQVERVRQAFYWVNLGDSLKEVTEHKFLWAPSQTESASGKRIVNAGWRHVPEVRKGDVIFCHENGQILYVAVAASDAYAAPRPPTRTFGKWHSQGFKIEVELISLPTPVETAVFRADFINLYNDRCDPKLFDVNGRASQQYLISLPGGAGAAILEAVGDPSIHVQEKASIATKPNKPRKGGQREAIVKARVGQGKFREDVLDIWKSQCPVTKVDMPEILTASHIVSWQLSNDEEKVDGYNGLPLSPAVDKLFDKGYISFSDAGELLVHPSLRGEVLARLGINPGATISGLDDRHRVYLRRHRHTHGFPG